MRKAAEKSAPPDAPRTAKAELPAELVYVDDLRPGYRRVMRGEQFAYRDDKGRWLRDPKHIDRIRKLAIPPAYTAVWICPLPNGHLQATGRDARGRKQYRYHAAFRQLRDDHKFDRMAAFGAALPKIRRRVQTDLQVSANAPPTRAVVLATLVRLLDTTFLRIGNRAYARENGSFGLTTLRSRHVKVEAGRLRLRFRGKSGVEADVTVDDPRLARAVRRCQQLPGQDLFKYVDEGGQPVSVSSTDVNDYLAEAAGERFTAKDFRTWHGSVEALELIRVAHLGTEATSAVAIVREVARQLGNTVAVCRKAYIHPMVLELAAALSERSVDASPIAPWAQIARAAGGLTARERRLLSVLA